MAAVIVLRGDRPGQDQLVSHDAISPDYHFPLLDYVDPLGGVWRHVDPDAWWVCDRQVPVYDRVPATP
jgi:hypothetical protein